MATAKKNGKRKKTTRNSKKKQEISQGLRILLASGFLLGFVIFCLVLLVSLRDQLLSEPDLVYEEPAQAIKTHKIYTHQDIYHLIETQLLNGPQSMGWRKLPPESGVQVRKVFGDYPSDLFLAELNSHIIDTKSPAQLVASRENGVIELLWQNDLVLELRYTVPEVSRSERGKIAIIMDDMGSSLSKFRRLLELDLMVTPAILPGTGQVRPGVELLRQYEREYMIHMPMQPRSYPRTNPGANALLLGQSESETRMLVRSYIEAVPGAVGGNNHMGSRYTEEVEPMRIVLDELKRNNQFFIDSRTIGNSVAFSEARKMGLKTATRNIFLDNEEKISYIREQIRKMARLAGTNREIIAICHPYDETLEALRLEREWLKKQPVDFVAASEIVHMY